MLKILYATDRKRYLTPLTFTITTISVSMNIGVIELKNSFFFTFSPPTMNEITNFVLNEMQYQHLRLCIVRNNEISWRYLLSRSLYYQINAGLLSQLHLLNCEHWTWIRCGMSSIILFKCRWIIQYIITLINHPDIWLF